MMADTEPLQFIQAFALVLSGWGVVIQIILGRIESFQFVRDISRDVSEYSFATRISGLLYTVFVVWLVVISGIFFYQATHSIQTLFFENTETYSTISYILDGLLILIIVVVLTFLYGIFDYLNKEERLTLISHIIVGDFILYSALYMNLIGIDSVLLSGIPTITGFVNIFPLEDASFFGMFYPFIVIIAVIFVFLTYFNADIIHI